MLSHTRASARPLIAVLALCTALAIVPATSASAATRPDVMKRVSQRLTAKTFEHQVLAMMRDRFGAASRSSAGRQGAKVVAAIGMFHIKSHNANFPNWFGAAGSIPGHTIVELATYRQGEDYAEEYEWFKELPASDVVVGKSAGRFEIHTGTDLGSFGGIDMTFDATHVGTHTSHCTSSHKVVAIHRRAQGAFSGSLSFVPGGVGFPGVIRATHPHASVERFVETGARCPRRFAFSCPRSRQFSVKGPDGGTLYLNPKYGFSIAQTDTMVDGVTVLRSIVIFPSFGGPGSRNDAVTLTRASLTIDGDTLGGIFSGTVVFDRSSPAVVHEGFCKRVNTPFLWSSGSLDVAFASGTYSFTGTDLSATLRWRGPAR